MNKKYFFFLVCGLCSSVFFSCKKEEDFTKGFIKYYGGIEVDDASGMQQTADGGYIIIGTTSTIGNGGSDMYLIKTDAAGNKEWEKTFGGSLDDQGVSVQQTSDGGYILLGTFRYDTYNPSSPLDTINTTDAYLIKTNSSGDTLWTRKHGEFNALRANEQGVSVRETLGGGYILLCNTNEGGDPDLLIVKTNSSGVMTQFGIHPSANAAGTDLGVNILQQADTTYVISSTSLGLNSPRAIFLGKLVSNPTSLAAPYNSGGFSELSMLTAGEIAFADNSTFILTGKTNTDNIFLIKMQNLGLKQWFKTYGGGGTDIGTSVQATPDGGYIVLGSTTSFGAGSRDIYLFKVDASGDNVEWSKTFGGTGIDEGRIVRNTSDGGYIILGTMEFGDDPSTKDNIICLIKVNSKGEIEN